MWVEQMRTAGATLDLIPYSLTSNQTVLSIIESASGSEIFQFLMFEWFVIYHICQDPYWGGAPIDHIQIKHLRRKW